MEFGRFQEALSVYLTYGVCHKMSTLHGRMESEICMPTDWAFEANRILEDSRKLGGSDLQNVYGEVQRSRANRVGPFEAMSQKGPTEAANNERAYMYYTAGTIGDKKIGVPCSLLIGMEFKFSIIITDKLNA